MKNPLDISRKRLAKNSIYNLIGSSVPFIAAVVALPMILKGIGIERLGILTLIWSIIGYFNIFDLGLGRALTYHLARSLSSQDRTESAPLVWTSLLLLLIVGVIGALISISLSEWLVYSVLNIPAHLRHETLISIYFLSISIPIITLTTGFRGVLNALQRFDLDNLVQIPMGMLIFLGPLLVIPFSSSLIPIIFTLIMIRLIALIVFIRLSFKVLPSLGSSISVRRNLIRPLFSFGGWMLLSNVISPLLVNFDRFLIGAVLSVKAVAYYTTPYEAITKLWVIPGALSRVLFAAISAIYKEDPPRTARLFIGGLKYVFISVFPIVLVISTFAFELFDIWLGREFALNSATVLRLLSIAVFLNCLGQIAINLIHGMGKPEIAAKLHLAELPFYCLTLWLLVKSMGTTGAAIAWLARVFFDSAILFFISCRLLNIRAKEWLPLILMTLASVMILSFSLLLVNTSTKTFYLIAVLSLFVFVVWKKMISPEDRLWINNFFKNPPILLK
ncbi:MAG TPA: flippase [Candidatus Omnitrophota bacterium]|nr:flippase [Candidatus Omnitrophota bacterium]